MYEEDAFLPVNEALDDRTRPQVQVRETQLMKAIATLTANSRVTRAGRSTPSSDASTRLAGTLAPMRLLGGIGLPSSGAK